MRVTSMGDEKRTKAVVYVQMRQYLRNKKGVLTLGKTKTITIKDATIPQVEAVLRKGGNGGRQEKDRPGK